MATKLGLATAVNRWSVVKAHSMIILLLLHCCVFPLYGYLNSEQTNHYSTYTREAQPPQSPASPTVTTSAALTIDGCPSSGLCTKLPASCITCKTNYSCVYGKPVTFECKIKPSVHCVDNLGNGQTSFFLTMTCQFCWQLPPSDYKCASSTNCMTVSCPRKRYSTNCTVYDHVHCLGNRTFPKMMFCNWTGGYKWSTALALSITLGGFGADRFYLGQWREGLGKLFSFGGLGIWTLIDVLLIGVGYVGPADGSLYI
ncbi:TM2 domain-containing protein 3 [Erpetoichthys calabaricus]|uniref:TM2 domain-containing protein 3 n=2 Tax=Polypteridae TaxID=8289 RepID=A0A8C4TI80_ERPCA|nr:TM2 domain-containing protein 3 [Erpetoichthys calabaricus]